MSHGPEEVFSVTPAIDALVAMDYTFLPREEAELARDGLNQVILRGVLPQAEPRFAYGRGLVRLSYAVCMIICYPKQRRGSRISAQR